MSLPLAVAFAGLLAQPAGVSWYAPYEKGVQLVQEGQGAQARTALEQALGLRSEEGLRLPTEGIRYVDYLPHLYLAVACHMAGDAAAAREHLSAAQRSGTAAKSEAGSRLLAAYEMLILGAQVEAAPAKAPPAAERPRYAIYAKKPPLLADAEFRRLQQDVLTRCHLGSGEAERAPWYFHYELGLELEKRGDHQRALDAFIESANRRAQPQHLARIYGVWFMDYLPYFQIARAHARLGNLECARDAFALSRRLGEVTEKDRDFAQLRALLKE